MKKRDYIKEEKTKNVAFTEEKGDGTGTRSFFRSKFFLVKWKHSAKTT
jgi:hypothetical protein